MARRRGVASYAFLDAHLGKPEGRPHQPTRRTEP
jgi:hypothetical protein